MTTTMTYATEQTAILSRFATAWGERTPIVWPNLTSPAPNESVAYAQPVVNRQDAFNATVAEKSKKVRHPGLLTINIFVPLDNTGDAAALAHGDYAAAIFRNVTFSGITFRAPTVRDLGPEGAWYRVQVDCPFYRDTVFAT